VGRAPMKAEDRDRVRVRILDAAGVVFARDGFERAHIDAVAVEAGVSTGTVYNYFAGKTDLVLDLHQRSLDAANADVEGLLARPAPFAEKLDIYLENFFRFTHESRTFLAILVESPHLLRLSPRHAEDQARRLRVQVERHLELLTGLLRAGISEGVLAPGDPFLLASVLLGTAKSLVLLAGDRVGTDQVEMALLVRRLFLDGARAR
jgi:TetR/AcrR family transcriptional regulator, fatty acid metabolism regulator protein